MNKPWAQMTPAEQAEVIDHRDRADAALRLSRAKDLARELQRDPRNAGRTYPVLDLPDDFYPF